MYTIRGGNTPIDLHVITWMRLEATLPNRASILSRNVFIGTEVENPIKAGNVREIFNLGDQFRYEVLFVEVVGTF